MFLYRFMYTNICTWNKVQEILANQLMCMPVEVCIKKTQGNNNNNNNLQCFFTKKTQISLYSIVLFLDCCWWPVPVPGHTQTDVYPSHVHGGHVLLSDSALCACISLWAVPLHPAHCTWWAVIRGVGLRDTQLVHLGQWVHADHHQHDVEHSDNGGGSRGDPQHPPPIEHTLHCAVGEYCVPACDAFQCHW